MKFLKLTSTDPYFNLAVEEYLFSHTCEDVFMLWQNSPSVIIGRNQNAYAEVDLEYAASQNINICRRITGGGAVYHDLGNINYSYITSNERASSLDYVFFSRPILHALSSLGLECELSGRNDITSNGKKISGNAQHSSNGRILHHGTLLFNTDSETLSRVLRIDKEKLDFHAVKSHKSRVGNIKELLGSKMSIDNFITSLERSATDLFSAEPFEAPQNDDILMLAARNMSHEWIYSDKAFLTEYTLTKKRRFYFGSVSLSLSLRSDIIEAISISGDFFSLRSVSELEEILHGKRLSDIYDIDISKYVKGMTNSDLKELLSN